MTRKTRHARMIVEEVSEVDIDYLTSSTGEGTHTAEAAATLAHYGQMLIADLGVGRLADAELSDWIARGDHVERRDRYATIRTLELLRARAIDFDPLPYPDIEPVEDDLYLRRRPLQPTEIGLVRFTAIHLRYIHAASVAVLDSGGTAGDYPGVGPDQVVIIDHQNRQGVFVLCGTSRIAARTNPIQSWAFDRVVAAKNAAQVREERLGDGHLPHIYPSICTDSRNHRGNVESAALMNVKTVLDATGLRQDPTVEPASIRNTHGREIWQTHSLEQAAHRLGVTDFNSLRREIGAAPHKPIQKR